MMNKELEIRTLTDRFFDGTTTIQEEKRLYELYRTEKLPDDLAPFREMMLDFASLSKNATSTEKVSSVSEKIAIEKPMKSRFSTLLAIAASLLLLVGVGLAWHHLDQSNECVAYVYGKRTTDRDIVMREMQTAMAAIANDEAAKTAEEQLKELFSE